MTLVIATTAAATERPPARPVPQPRGSRLSVTAARRRHVPKPSGKPDPTAHLSAEDVEALGSELDALRQEVLASRGARDAAYIRRVITVQRSLEMGSRAVLLFSILPPAWIAGTAGLAIAKILENMEIGHNVMHGQWDWMRDPKIHSSVWEWDHASPAELWKRSHNELHHTYTNVLDRDNDLGYGIMRVDEDQPWEPGHLAQPLVNLLNACFFEYGIAAYDLGTGRHLREGTTDDPEFRRELRLVLRKVRRQLTKDYVVHPLLSGPSVLHTLAANAVANLVRNLWSHSVIMCGHFPEGVETFATDSIEGETRGEWYLRQMIGSANIAGPWAVHVMTGNLSHQIEHHLFPDLPSNRYAEIAPRVREICERYGLSYTTGSLPRQVASAWGKVVRLSLPNPGERRAALAGAASDVVAGARRVAMRVWERRPALPVSAPVAVPA
jgi:linoleoyl-CoA desaturase